MNRDDRDGYGRGGFGGGGRGFSAADDDRSWRRDEPEIPVRRDIREERSERPKLNILPRSKPANENSGLFHGPFSPFRRSLIFHGLIFFRFLTSPKGIKSIRGS